MGKEENKSTNMSNTRETSNQIYSQESKLKNNLFLISSVPL